MLEELQQDLLNFFEKVTEIVRNAFDNTNSAANSSNPALSVDLLSCVRLMCRIYFSLNWQTIPEFYEDNIQKYMNAFHFFLSKTDYNFGNDETVTMMIRIQSAIIINLKLYAEKYDEEFQPFLELVKFKI